MEGNNRIAPRWADGSLRSAIESELSALDSQITEKRLTVELYVARQAAVSNCDFDLRSLVKELLETAVARSPAGATIELSALATRRGIEVEVADEGPDAQPSSPHACGAFFAQRIGEMDRLVHTDYSSDHVQFFAARCPQGGMAWTVVYRPRLSAIRAA